MNHRVTDQTRNGDLKKRHTEIVPKGMRLNPVPDYGLSS